MRLFARTFGALIAVVAFAAVLAGCGGSNAKTTTTSVANKSATQSTSAATPAAQITTKSSSLGTILAAGDKNMTVYLFEADSGSTSNCSGACAAVWPPVLTGGSPTAGGSAKSSKLGTTKRSDGKMQVTYGGHPLYYYAKDGDAGDAYGQGINGFGGLWYVMSPSGSKITKSSGSAAKTSSSSSSSSSSSGYGGY